MKKTLLIAAFAMATNAMADVTSYLYNGDPNGDNLLAVDDETGSMKYIVLKSDGAITTLDEFNAATPKELWLNSETINFSLDSALNLNGILTDNNAGSRPKYITIDFGTSGSISTVYQTNFGQAHKDSGASLKFKLTLDSVQWEEDGTFTRDLMKVTDSNYTFWNLGDFCALKSFCLDLTWSEGSDYENKGYVASAEALSAGQYGFVLSNNRTASFVMKQAITVPEPATATLSLLALAGLAARRRRH